MSDIELHAIWLPLLGTALIGLLIGLLVGPRIGRARKASKTLHEVQEEHSQYKREVTDHFEKTAQLFASLTEDYRELYRHLADGSERLAEGVSPSLAMTAAALPAVETDEAVNELPTPPDASEITANTEDHLAETESQSDVVPMNVEVDLDAQLRAAADQIGSTEEVQSSPQSQG